MRLHALHTIAQTEFVRTQLWPMLLTVLTGGAGVLGHISGMYILVACGVMFAAITTGLLRANEYRERRTPLNKILFLGIQVPVTVTPAPLLLPYVAGNRRQRRAQNSTPQQPAAIPPMLSSTTLVPGIKRTLQSAQIGAVLRNSASFPISCILERSETEIATLRPPRSRFPKQPSTISPGATFFVNDEPIDMEEIPAGKLTGKIDMVVKYGLPGNEIYEFPIKGDVYIEMEDFGMVKQVTTAWVT
jgi:hypothetical protein